MNREAAGMLIKALINYKDPMKYSRSLAWIASTALLMAVVVAPVSSNAASSSDFTAAETVANVAVGGDLTQAVATTSTTANVVGVKATRTLAVGAVPANAETVTIGACVITFSTAGTQDTDCSNTNALVNITTDSTPTLVAARIRSIATSTDTGHGSITFTGATTNVIVTTTNAETAATPITFTDGTTGDITSSSTTSGTVPVAQVWRVTPSGTIEEGDVFTTIINGTTVSFTATSSALADATYGITTAINANSTVAAAVTAVNAGTRVDVTSDVAGTPFTATVSAANRAAVAQTVTFTPNTLGNYNYTITLGGVAHVVRGATSLSANELVEDLVLALNANAFATCTEDNIKVTCVALVAGTSFTYDVDMVSPGNGSSGGGGGSSHHSSGGGGGGSNSSSNGNVPVTTPVGPAATGNSSSNASPMASFNRDLEVGVSGADVMALQVYLNNHGYMVAMTGPGSKGSETMLFGALTKAALMKLQTAAGITPVAGYFGPKTRAYVAAHQ
ncbi:MAG: hypothetical protein JWN64_451 [Parcubacteria group bacterium]|nr:hypothetical protein [Parcubacteria group bacterium]